MIKATKMHVLLLVIFTFAFVYRIIFMLWQTYPPGADIGVHTSVINSIMHPENPSLLWNYYQMGGGITLAFPGYHIFASIIISITGISSYLAQAISVALFSSLTVMSAFLVTRLVWSESAAFIAAFFMAVSGFDIEMLLWGGYPSIIALLLIPLIFYLFLKREKFTLTPFLVSTSILAAALLLTHSVSAAVFVGIITVTSLAVLVFPNVFHQSRKNVLYWVLPVIIGAIIISPFLASAAPVYLNESAAFTGATAIEQAVLEHQTVPIELVLAFFACIVPFFLLSKKLKGQYFSFPVFLLVIWLLVPLLLTQGYLFGFYVDYVRFQYFLIIPVIILLAVMTDYASTCFANILRLKNLTKINYKKLYTAFLASFVLVMFFCLPIFFVPWRGVEVQGFYQVMNDAGYQAIEWAEQNTPEESLFVSDHYYGWWLAGFGKRPTITAVDLQYLTLAREVSMSKNASYLLDTSYLIDNGYIQVREDGGYVGRHNPQFLIDLSWTDFPFGFFQFNSSEITLIYHDGNNMQTISVAELPVTSMQLISANGDSSSIVVNKANSDVSYSEIVTVTKGQLFANMTINVQSNKPTVSLDLLTFVTNSPGTLHKTFNNTIGIIDPEMNVCGQLIFEQAQPQVTNLNSQHPVTTQLSYDLQGNADTEIQILVGIYEVSMVTLDHLSTYDLKGILSENLVDVAAVPDLPLTTFDYKVALQQYNVSYIANRDFELNPKFADDPDFYLVFINNEVAFFKVKNSVNLEEG